jgi:hypothetical protein
MLKIPSKILTHDRASFTCLDYHTRTDFDRD